MQLPEGWIQLSGDLATKLEAELRREMPAGHQLYGRAVRAIARRADRDDVLFKATQDKTVFWVHLTWSVERDAKWPWTRDYKDHDDFLERWPQEELDDSQ